MGACISSTDSTPSNDTKANKTNTTDAVKKRNIVQSYKSILKTPSQSNTQSFAVKLVQSIINGYFKELKSQNVILFDIIPSEIVQLCVLFYGEHYSKSVYFSCPNSNGTQIAKFDMNSAEITYFKGGTDQLRIKIQRLCYISDIIPDEEIDVILCWKFMKKELIMMVVDRSKEKVGNDGPECKMEHFSIGYECHGFMLYDERQIFCVQNGRMHSMVLSTNMNDIINNDKFEIWDENILWREFDGVDLCNLPNRQQIFAISNNQACRKCGIFNISDRKWYRIKLQSDIQYGGYNYFHEKGGLRICYDGLNMVYLVSKTGYVYSYDLDKDEWKTVTGKRYWNAPSSCIVWIEPLDRDCIYFMCTSSDTGKVELKYFNIESTKWKKRNGYDVISKKLGKRTVVLD